MEKIKNMSIGKRIISLLLGITLLFSIFNIFRVGAKEPALIVTNAIIDSKSPTVEANISNFTNTEVFSNITYHKLNDYVSYTITLKNNEDKEITIKDITDDNTYSYLVYEYDKHVDEKIASKDSINLVIKASYKNEAEYNSSSNKDVRITIKYEMDDEEKEAVVPITGDNLYIYIILLIVSTIGLVITFVANKKIKKTMVLLLLIAPFVTKALVDTTIVTLKQNIKIQDKQTVKYIAEDNEISERVHYGETANQPSDPEKEGYNFLGWFLNDNIYGFDNPVTSDLTLIAKFEPKDVTYHVIHKQQNINNDEYTEFETQDLPGKYDDSVTPAVKEYTGFTSPSTQTVTLGLDTTITYEYTRNKYNVTYQYEGTIPSNAPALPQESEHKYGANVTIEANPTLDGYTFSGWNTSAFTMPDHDVVIKGSFTANGDTPFKTEHYGQNIDNDEYTLLETTNGTGQTDTQATAVDKPFEGFTYDENNANNVKTGNIEGNGSLVLKLYYTRNTHKVKYVYTNTTLPTDATDLRGEEVYRFEKTVTVKENATASGYSFAWDRSGTFTMPDEDVTISGTFTPLTVNYTVEHWTEKLDGTFELLNDNIETKQGTTDTTGTGTEKTITGFTYDSSVEGTKTSGTIAGDGSLVLKLYYKRNVHNVIYTYANEPDGRSQLPATVGHKYGETISIAPNATAPGYSFAWDRTEAFEMPDSEVTITGTFTANTNTPYTVYHRYMNLDEQTYDEVVFNGTGITDDVITLEFIPREGFNNPEAKTLRITGDGQASEIYVYQRKPINFTLNDPFNSVTSTKPTGTYPYGTQITATAEQVEGYTFVKWSNDETTNEITVTLLTDTTIEPVYQINNYTLSYEYFDDSENKTVTLPTGGSKEYNSSVTVADPLSLTGYTFDGWYDGENKVTSFNMPARDVTLKGRFTADTVNYTIETYKENIENTEYTMTSTTGSGKTGTTASVTPDTIEGFVYDTENTNNVLEGTILGDGSLTLKLYYKRIRNNVTYEYFDDSENKSVTLPASASYKYGASINVAPELSSTGYTFDGWYNGDTKVTDPTITMGTSAITLKGRLTADTVNYTIETYKENIDDSNYTMTSTTGSGKTGATASVTPETIEGFVYDENANNVTSGTIAGDGSLVLKLYYKRVTNNVTYEYFDDSENKTVTLPTGGTYKYGASINVAPELSSTGYTFDGWYNDGNKVTDPTITMGTSAITLKGRLTADTVNYTIETYKENIENTEYTMTSTTGSGKTGATATVTPDTIEGFEYDENADNVTSGTILGDGSLVLKLYYKRVTNTLTYSYFDDSENKTVTLPTGGTYKYGASINVAPELSSTGYTFDGWYNGDTKVTDPTITMGTSAITLKGRLTADTVNYTIETYKENIENTEYTMTSTTGSGKTGTTASVTPDTIEGFGYETENTNNVTSGTIAGDGSLVLKLYYRRVRNNVVYEYFDNSVIKPQALLPTAVEYKYGATVPVNPELTSEGYTFDGWYNGDTKVTDPTIAMGTSAITLKGKFTANENTAYTVQHLTEKLNEPGSYELLTGNTSIEHGTTGTIVTAQSKPIEGFTYSETLSLPTKSGEIAGDGSLILKLYYTRNSHQVTYAYTNNFIPEGASNLPSSPQDYKYGAAVTIPTNVTAPAGYSFAWDVTENFNMPDENVTITGTFTPLTVNYTVQHWTEKLDGTFELLDDNIETLSGITDTTATSIEKTIAHYHYDSQNTNNVISGTIKGDGSLVLKRYYLLDLHTITFNTTTGDTYNGDLVIDDVVITKKYGATLAVSEHPTKPTYDPTNLKPSTGVSVDKRHNALLGWYTEKTAGSQITTPVTITEDKVYYAHWEDVPLMCKKGTSLHTEECQREDSHGCHNNGYSENGYYHTTTIVYGETSNSTTPKYGDAYDCDINNDQVYDPVLERFYFVRQDENDNYILIYSSNWDGEKINTTLNFNRTNAKNKIPNGKHTQWFNTDSAANVRFPDYYQVQTLCGTNLKSCEILLEKSAYQFDVDNLPSSYPTYPTKPWRSGIWIMKDNEFWRVQTSTLEITNNTTSNVIKPVIIVPADAMATTVLPTYNVTYDSRGGTLGTYGEIQVVPIPSGSAIRVLPTPTKANNTFKGWYTSTNFDTPVQLPIIVTENTTIYAKWTTTTGNVAEKGGVEYPTLQEAINAVDENDESPTTIILLKDTSEDTIIDGNKNISLNLNGQTVSNTANDKHVFTVNSGSTLQIHSGTVTSNADASMIYVNGGTVKIDEGAYRTTGNGEALSNNGGDVVISANVEITSSSTTNPAILNNGSLSIQRGTITSTGGIAIYNESGSLVLGKIEDLSPQPTIQGKTYGIVSKVDYDYYDGTIKGITYPVGIATGDTPTIEPDTEKTKIAHRETNTIYTHGNELQDSDLYQTINLRYYDNVFVLTFDAGEGTPQTQTLVINRGDAVGVLPNEPTRLHYTFEGWYKTPELNDGDEVTAETIPTADPNLNPTDHATAYITYYAKWEESQLQDYTITWDANGGKFTDTNSETLVEEYVEDTVINAFPTPPSRATEGYVFEGWCTDTNCTTTVTLPITVDGNKTYYAKWNGSYTAMIGTTGYASLKLALAAVPNNGTKTTVVLLKDITEKNKINGNYYVDLDLNGHTINVNVSGGGDNVLELTNNAKLEVRNGTLKANGPAAPINIRKNCEAIVHDVAIIVEGESVKQAIYNEGGKLTIYDGAYIYSESPLEGNSVNVRAAVHSLNNGGQTATTIIYGGTIISKYYIGVYSDSGLLTIGNQNDSLSTSSPLIQGGTYGVAINNTNMNNFNFYDGIIKGATYSVGKTKTEDDTDYSKVVIESDKALLQGTEVIDSVTYDTLTLVPEGKYRLTFDANGGEVSQEYMLIDQGSAIGLLLPTASWDSDHEFLGWFTERNGGSKITALTIPTGNTTYFAHWNEKDKLTITFESEGGSEVPAQQVAEGGTLDEIPTSTRTGYRLEGWYTERNGEGSKLTLETTFTANATYYANWEEVTKICRKATSLHKVSCPSGEGCSRDNAAVDGILTYGVDVSGNTLLPGKALDCDVNGDGTFDSTTERFYYVTSNGDNAVLIYYNNYPLINSSGQYADAINLLPSNSEWGNLPITFTGDFNGKVARFVTKDEMVAACPNAAATSGNPLNNCSYFLENTRFDTTSDNGGKSGIWVAKEGNTLHRYMTGPGNDQHRIQTPSNVSSNNAVRPTIEVPLDQIDLNYSEPVTKYTITYNAGSGTVTPTSEEYDAGSQVTSFPTPVYTGHIFDGWFTDATNGNLVSSIVLTGDTTIFAHYADIDTTAVSIAEGGTHNVFNTQPNNISDYSIESTDTSIATVSNGVINGVSAGNTTVTVTNTTNSQSITLNVEVTGNPKAYTTSQAVKEYYENVSSLETQFASDGDQTAYTNQLKAIFTANKCSYCGSSVDDQGANSCSPSSGANANVYCDQPMGYDTGVNGAVNVYTDDTKTTPVTYTTSTDGTIYNMIPGEKYYWEDANDSSVNGTVEAVGERRLLKASGVRNLRDLGGMAVSYTDGTGTKTGTLKYEKLYRGAQITSASGVTELEKLGIDREIDLRATSEQNTSNKLNKYDTGTKDSYTDIVVVNYHINPVATAYLPTESDPATSVSVEHQCGKNHLDEYRKMKAVVRQVMKNVIAGESIFFHCTIGTDRTGTLAYFLEGLLGVGEMDRLRDYELTYYYGLTNRSRFHDKLGSTINPRFYSMYRSYPTNDDIYDWYTYESTVTSTNDPLTDDQLLAQFRAAMIDYNN